MNSLNLDVITATEKWLQQGSLVYFVTVLETWGASPRPKGSLFAFNINKQTQVGSLSGGCIEEDLLSFLLTHSENFNDSKKQPFTKIYGGKNTDHNRYLLPCGGSLKLLIEPLFGEEDKQHISKIKEALVSNFPIARKLNFTGNKLALNQMDTVESSLREKTLVFNDETTELYHRLDPVYKLLLIGAGDVSYYVQIFAESLDFNISICEPRAGYLNKLESFKGHKNIKNVLPDDLIRSQFSDEFTAILCLAHDPKVDDMALLEALTNSKAFYIGALGSLSSSENRIKRLQSLGVNDLQLKRLHAPIGIDIQSKTPQEIAISILAELVKVRNQHRYT